MQLDFLAGQVLAFAADDAAVFGSVAQLAFVQHEEAFSGLLRLDPVGHGRAWCDFHGGRAHRQRAHDFTQGRQQVFGALGAGRVDQDHPQARGDGGEDHRAANEGTRQEGLDDLVLDLVAFLLVDLAHLLGLDLFDLFLDGIVDHAARQDALFLARGNQQELAADMHQRRVFALAERRDETIRGQLLAGAGAGRLAGQCGFQCFRLERDILGQAVGQQVLEPHEGESLLYT
ncbi:hypothetical protein D3C79_639570 [compost metagenome]